MYEKSDFAVAITITKLTTDFAVAITITKLTTNRFVYTTKLSIKYFVNWIPLRIRVRSRHTQLNLKVGLSVWEFCAISRRLISKI